jgi:hypothetical protein
MVPKLHLPVSARPKISSKRTCSSSSSSSGKDDFYSSGTEHDKRTVREQ